MLPEDFDWEIYLSLNDDVNHHFPTKDDAIKHYLDYGINEKRLYITKHIPSDFDWEYYLILNQDVYIYFKNKIGSLYHYETFGYNENRLYKRNRQQQSI